MIITLDYDYHFPQVHLTPLLDQMYELYIFEHGCPLVPEILKSSHI